MLSKKRVHYMRVRVVFNRPIAVNKATDVFREKLPPDKFFTQCDGTEFQIKRVARETGK
jgi:hypothetical protein